MIVNVDFDRENNVAYIYLKAIKQAEAARQYRLDAPGVATEVILDFDKDGRLLGIELLNPKGGLPEEFLAAIESND